MNPNNINGLGNLESSTSPVHSLEGGTTQIEIGRVSIETQAPHPLSKLIHIYNDDESLKSSHATPMCVQEEGGPEKTSSREPKKTSSPQPKFQYQEVSQKETETKIGLNTKGPNESEVEVNLNEGLELEEMNKGSPQNEIKISVANEQVTSLYLILPLCPMLKSPTSDIWELDPQDTTRKFMSPTLNKYTPPVVWETN
jgi:hypothetical protein